MVACLDLTKRIYDLYGFDVPYDRETGTASGSSQHYLESLSTEGRPRARSAEDDQDGLDGLGLTFEEAGHESHGPDWGGPVASDLKGTGGDPASRAPVLGATLSQRKKLLGERIDELVADVRKRERLEQELLQKADAEGSGLEFLLGQVKSWSLGNYPSVDARRTNLEREILGLKKAGWDEKLRCWRDLVMMKKELRTAIEEYDLISSAEGL